MIPNNIIVDTRAALANGVSTSLILTEAEKFFGKHYHSFHVDWDYDHYSYLADGDLNTITGIRPGGIEGRLLNGAKLVNWYDMFKNQQVMMKIFNDNKKFAEELL